MGIYADAQGEGVIIDSHIQVSENSWQSALDKVGERSIMNIKPEQLLSMAYLAQKYQQHCSAEN